MMIALSTTLNPSPHTKSHQKISPSRYPVQQEFVVSQKNSPFTSATVAFVIALSYPSPHTKSHQKKIPLPLTSAAGTRLPNTNSRNVVLNIDNCFVHNVEPITSHKITSKKHPPPAYQCDRNSLPRASSRMLWSASVMALSSMGTSSAACSRWMVLARCT